jgi:hypothetical protein
MKKSEECFIGNCIYPAKLFIKNLFAKGSVLWQLRQELNSFSNHIQNYSSLKQAFPRATMAQDTLLMMS